MGSSVLAEKPARASEGNGSLVKLLPLPGFFHLDTRALALFRIGVALLLLFDYADRLPDLSAHYSDSGAVPRSRLPPDVAISIHVLHGSAWWSGLLMGIGVIFALLLLIGYQTRLAMFLSWF